MKIEDTDVPIGINGWLLHLSQTYCVKLMGLYESSSGLTGWREKDILAWTLALLEVCVWLLPEVFCEQDVGRGGLAVE